jgi:glycerophosphoryl diester phosphodiesterase
VERSLLKIRWQACAAVSNTLSGDGVPVLMHDPYFGRTIAGKGNVAETSAQDLTAMDAGAWFGAQFAGERVPTLQQVADYCMENRIWMNIELKPAPGLAVETGRVTGAFMKATLATNRDASLTPLFSSFAPDALIAARAVAPEIPRGLLATYVAEDWRERLDAVGAIALHTDAKRMTPLLAKEITSAGFGLFCYTVNDPAQARELFDWGVDAFCTDRLDLIAADFS